MKTVVAFILFAPFGLGLAAERQSVNQELAADLQGAVDINNTSGTVIVSVWDKPMVAVSGKLGEDVERLDFARHGNDIVVHVIRRSTAGWPPSDGHPLAPVPPIRD